MHLKHILRQVEPDRGNPQNDRPPLWILVDPSWNIDAVGGRSHHVWVAPILAGYRLSWHHTIECVHVSGLFVRGVHPFGRYGIRGLGSKHQTELEALHVTLIFPTPIWSIDFILASASPAFSRRRCRFSQVADSGPPRNSSSFVIMAHSMRAILFASAMAASILGLRVRIRASQEVFAGG